MKWELLLPGCTTNSAPRSLPPSTTHCGRPLPSDWQRSHQVDLQLGHVSLHRWLPPAACWRIFCNVTLETPPFRLPTPPPAVPLRSVPPPVTLTLDLTLLEFFNYTTSASSGIGKRWRTCNAGAAARQLDVKQCASMCGKVAALRSAMLQPV